MKTNLPKGSNLPAHDPSSYQSKVIKVQMRSITTISCFRQVFLGIFLLLGIVTSASAQYRTRKTVKKEYYPDGVSIQRVIKTRTRTEADVDIHHYYKRTILEITEFDESGSIKSQRKKIHNSGNSGRPYHDVLSDIKEYDEKGTLRMRTISKCDGLKVDRLEYDQHGKLIYESKIWRK